MTSRKETKNITKKKKNVVFLWILSAIYSWFWDSIIFFTPIDVNYQNCWIICANLVKQRELTTDDPKHAIYPKQGNIHVLSKRSPSNFAANI